VQIIFVTLMLVVVPLVLYVAFFYIHFALLPNPGPGNHLMTSRFASSQANGFPVRDFAANLWELHRKMLSVHVSMFDHPYGSVWCTWPLMIRPLLYWQGSVAVGHGSVTPARIYLLGNPIIWVICTLLTAIFLLSFTFRITTKGLRLWLTWPSLGTNASRKENHGNTDVFLAIGYLVNWLPFAFISRGDVPLSLLNCINLLYNNRKHHASASSEGPKFNTRGCDRAGLCRLPNRLATYVRLAS